MRTVTLKMDEDLVKALDAEAEEQNYSSRSGYIRDVLKSRNSTDKHDEITEEYESKIREYEDDIAELEREVERQQRERRQLLEVRDEHQELVEVVQDEQSLAQRRAQAGVLTRAKWWFAGMPSE